MATARVRLVRTITVAAALAPVATLLSTTPSATAAPPGDVPWGPRGPKAGELDAGTPVNLSLLGASKIEVQVMHAYG